MLSSKYAQKLPDTAKKISNRCDKNCFKKSNPKTAESTDDLIGNKIPEKLTSVSKKSKKTQNNEANDESEASKERYISQRKDNKLLLN